MTRDRVWPDPAPDPPTEHSHDPIPQPEPHRRWWQILRKDGDE